MRLLYGNREKYSFLADDPCNSCSERQWMAVDRLAFDDFRHWFKGEFGGPRKKLGVASCFIMPPFRTITSIFLTSPLREIINPQVGLVNENISRRRFRRRSKSSRGISLLPTSHVAIVKHEFGPY
jgi:hypothetical protein